MLYMILQKKEEKKDFSILFLFLNTIYNNTLFLLFNNLLQALNTTQLNR